MRMATKARGH